MPLNRFVLSYVVTRLNVIRRDRMLRNPNIIGLGIKKLRVSPPPPETFLNTVRHSSSRYNQLRALICEKVFRAIQISYRESHWTESVFFSWNQHEHSIWEITREKCLYVYFFTTAYTFPRVRKRLKFKHDSFAIFFFF